MIVSGEYLSVYKDTAIATVKRNCGGVFPCMGPTVVSKMGIPYMKLKRAYDVFFKQLKRATYYITHLVCIACHHFDTWNTWIAN